MKDGANEGEDDKGGGSPTLTFLNAHTHTQLSIGHFSVGVFGKYAMTAFLKSKENVVLSFV